MSRDSLGPSVVYGCMGEPLVLEITERGRQISRTPGTATTQTEELRDLKRYLLRCLTLFYERPTDRSQFGRSTFERPLKHPPSYLKENQTEAYPSL